MSALRLQQLIYTSFDRLGYKSITGLNVPPAIQTIFMEKVVQQSWNDQNPPETNFQLNYLYQVSPYSVLFGWMYIDEVDGQRLPYFVCYYLENSLNLASLAKILTCLSRGPHNMLDRFFPLAFLEDIYLDFDEVDTYKPARPGVVISSEYRNQCLMFLQQGRFINLLSTTEQQASFQPIVDNHSVPDNTSPAMPMRSQQNSPSRSILWVRQLQHIALPTLKTYLKKPTFQITALLVLTGSLLASVLPKMLSGRHQTANISPEILKPESKPLESSIQTPKPENQPETVPNQPLQPRPKLNSAPLPDPTLLSPFVDLNLQNYHLHNKQPNSSDSTSSSLSTSTPSPTSRPQRSIPTRNTPNPAPQGQLFSTFNVQEVAPSSPDFGASTPPSLSSPTAAEPSPTPIQEQMPATPPSDNIATGSPSNTSPPSIGDTTLPLTTTPFPSPSPDPSPADAMLDE